MYGWGRFVHRARWFVLIGSLFGTVAAALFGLGVLAPNVLKQGGFEDPHASSTFVYKTAAAVFGSANPHVMLVYRSPDHKVSDPEFEQAVLFTVARLPREHVMSVLSYWHIPGNTQQAKDGRRDIVSHDGKSTFVALVLPGSTDDERLQHYLAIKDSFEAPGMTMQQGGAIPIGLDFVTQMTEDLKKAEILSLPLVVIIGLMVFGSVTAALMPLFVAIFSIVGALAVLHGITFVTDVSNFALQLVTMLAAGLAIDYSLFIISRYREELDRGRDRETAMGVTMATAGRTVAFSAVTVAASMAGLLLFPQMFLRSIGIAGIAVILVSLVVALILLPALLAVVGRRIEFGKMPWRRHQKSREEREEHGAWHRLAHSVMRRPTIYFLGVSAILVALVWPFGHIQFANADIRALPKDMPTRQVVETIQRDFSGGVLDPIDVLLDGTIVTKDYKPGKTELPPNLERFRKVVTALPGVTSAQYMAYDNGAGLVRMQVTYEGEANSEETKGLVKKIRTLAPPEGVRYISVGGSTALQMDLMDSLMKTLPKTALFVGVAIFLLLFAAFGSVFLPFKAILMNLLSIGSSFGAIVWAFQDGHLAEFLDFTPTGTVDASSMILILAIVFGLSMDYEVFLLSRIREEWDKTHDNRAAVAVGLQRTGGIITSAAVLLIVVVAAFSTAEITVVKVIGVGLLVAVVVDATLVRSLLVPATMRYLGDWNWWLPGPLKRLHAAIDLREVHDIDVTPKTPATLEKTKQDVPVPALRVPVPAGAARGPSVRGTATRTSAVRTAPAQQIRHAAPARRTVERTATGFTWSSGNGSAQHSRINGHSGNKREIVANPDGPGWRWVDVEEHIAH